MRLVLLGGLLALWTPGLHGQDSKAPEWKHAMDLRVRKAGEKDFTAATKKIGVEVYLDPNSGKLVYISETGSLAAVTGNAPGGMAKAPDWKHAMELQVRKVGEEDFSKDTKKYGVEVYKDENTNHLIYICETGDLAVVAAGDVGDGSKPPLWKHALKLKARKAGEEKWANAPYYGIEVFRDENAGNLIYICENGMLSVLPGTASGEAKVKPPEWKHAVELKVRKAGEPHWNKDALKFGVEIFLDPNTGKTVYITEKGSLAVVATAGGQPDKKDPEWKYGIEMYARKAGETKFEGSKRYGLENFTDDFTGSMLYLSETGTIAALPAK
jgi:hypothetical protein